MNAAPLGPRSSVGPPEPHPGAPRLGPADRSGAREGGQGQSPTGEGYLGCSPNADPRRDTPVGGGSQTRSVPAGGG